jgi:hypothetical protein
MWAVSLFHSPAFETVRQFRPGPRRVPILDVLGCYFALGCVLSYTCMTCLTESWV